MNAKEYVGQILNEGAPSWIKRLPLSDLEKYEKEHPGVSDVTKRYINQEIFSRKGKYPSWLTNNVSSVPRDMKDTLIKYVGKENLSNGVEVVEKDKLTKAPYSQGLVVVFDEKGKYLGKFEGSSVWGNFKNRKDAIESGSKFIYIKKTSDKTKELETHNERWKNKNNSDELADKSKTTHYGQNNVKEFYTKKLAAFKQEKYGKDIDEKIQKINDKVKQEIQDSVIKSLENVFSGNSYGGIKLVDDKLEKKLNAISELNRLQREVKKNGKFTYEHEAAKYNDLLKQLGF